ncbi:MAG: hypothetical protein E4H01_03900 [Lysobacterales bacterium]|nr:MAG: hypothetical protein E4H01_03900 [Xanthomonadales bacterium]
MNLIVSLIDSSTTVPGTIGAWTEPAAVSSYSDYAHTLTTAQADSILDYTALRLQFEAASGQSPVTFDASTDGILNASPQVVTVSHTSSGSNRGYFVAVCWFGDTGTTSSTVTYDGVAATKMWDIEETSNRHCAGWYGVAQGTGALDVVSTISTTGLSEHWVGVISMNNVNQTTPVGTDVSDSSDASPQTLTVASVGTNDMVVDCIHGEGGGAAPAVEADQTQRDAETGTSAGQHYANSTQAGSDGGVMSWTVINNYWVAGAVAFKPV